MGRPGALGVVVDRSGPDHGIRLGTARPPRRKAHERRNESEEWIIDSPHQGRWIHVRRRRRERTLKRRWVGACGDRRALRSQVRERRVDHQVVTKRHAHVDRHPNRCVVDLLGTNSPRQDNGPLLRRYPDPVRSRDRIGPEGDGHQKLGPRAGRGRLCRRDAARRQRSPRYSPDAGALEALTSTATPIVASSAVTVDRRPNRCGLMFAPSWLPTARTGTLAEIRRRRLIESTVALPVPARAPPTEFVENGAGAGDRGSAQ